MFIWNHNLSFYDSITFWRPWKMNAFQFSIQITDINSANDKTLMNSNCNCVWLVLVYDLVWSKLNWCCAFFCLFITSSIFCMDGGCVCLCLCVLKMCLAHYKNNNTLSIDISIPFDMRLKRLRCFFPPASRISGCVCQNIVWM